MTDITTQDRCDRILLKVHTSEKKASKVRSFRPVSELKLQMLQILPPGCCLTSYTSKLGRGWVGEGGGGGWLTIMRRHQQTFGSLREPYTNSWRLENRLLEALSPGRSKYF